LPRLVSKQLDLPRVKLDVLSHQARSFRLADTCQANKLDKIGALIRAMTVEHLAAYVSDDCLELIETRCQPNWLLALAILQLDKRTIRVVAVTHSQREYIPQRCNKRVAMTGTHFSGVLSEPHFKLRWLDFTEWQRVRAIECLFQSRDNPAPRLLR